MLYVVGGPEENEVLLYRYRGSCYVRICTRADAWLVLSWRCETP